METIHLQFKQDGRVWYAESPELANWLAVGPSLDRVRQLAYEGVTFALEGRLAAIVEEPRSHWSILVASATAGKITAATTRVTETVRASTGELAVA